MHDYSKLKWLVPGKRYTLCAMAEFGFPYACRMTFTSVNVHPWAQYPETYLIRCLPKRKKIPMGLRFYDIKDLIIWEGWVEPKVDMYVRRSVMDSDYGPVTVRESLRCFDRKYLRIALESVKQKPLIALIKDPDVLSVPLREVET